MGKECDCTSCSNDRKQLHCIKCGDVLVDLPTQGMMRQCPSCKTKYQVNISRFSMSVACSNGDEREELSRSDYLEIQHKLKKHGDTS